MRLSYDFVMLSSSLTLAALIFLMIANNRADRSLLYPPFIFTSVWVVVVFFYLVGNLIDSFPMDRITNSTWLYLVSANIIFSVAGLAVNQTMKPVIPQQVFCPTRIPRLADDIIFFTVPLSLVFLIGKAIDLAAGIDGSNILISLRYQFIANRLNYGILDYFLVFGLFAALFRLYTFSRFSDLSKDGKRRFIISMVLALLFLILSTGRTYFFFFFITIFLTTWHKGNFRLKHSLSLLAILVAVFFIFGLVLAKSGRMEYSFSKNLALGLKHMGEYLEGPILSFNKFYNSDFDHTFGENTFRFFIALLNAAGLSAREPLDLFREYVYVPFPANVYTLFYHYVEDFGTLGSFLFVALFGVLNTWLFYRSRLGSNFIKIITAFSYYPLIMVFFQDQYISLTSFWIQLLFYSWLTFIVLGRRGNAG